MFKNTKAFSGFAVDDLDKAREFYGETLGLKTSEEHGLLTLHLAGDRPTFVYPKPDIEPANYTILNFPVDDIDEAVERAGSARRELRALRRLRAGRARDRPGRGPLHRLVQGSRREHPLGAAGAVGRVGCAKCAL